MELKLKEDNYYEILFHNTSDLIYELDENGRYLRVNQAVCDQTGYTAHELTQMTCWDMVPNHYVDQIKAHYGKILKARKSSDYVEFPILTKNNELIWMSQSVHFIYDGNVAHRAYAIAKNITKSKQRELQKDKHMEGLKLLNIIQNSTDLSLDDQLTNALELCTKFLDLEVGIISKIDGSDYYVKFFYPEGAGLSRKQRFDRDGTYCDITFEANHVVAIDEMSSSIYRDHPCYRNFKLESYIGEVYHINGKPTGTVNFSSINRRKKNFTPYEMELVSLLAKWVGSVIERSVFVEQLSESEEKYKMLSENSQDGIALFENDQIKYVSEGYVEMLGYSQEEFLNMTVEDTFLMVDDDEKARVHQILEESRKSKEKHIMYDVKIRHKKGHLLWIENELSRVFDQHGELLSTIVHARNITARKHAEEELARSNSRLKEINKEKDKLIAIIGHDLRNPLAAVKSLSEIIASDEDDVDSEFLTEIGGTINSAAKRSLSLIEEIINWGNVTSQSSAQQEVNIEELIQKTFELFHLNVEEKEIKCRINCNNISKVKCNQFVLELILRNLISNAIKFTPNEGKIDVSTILEDNSLILEVKDSGVGMNEETAHKILQMDSRETKRGTNNEQGTGLGLKLCVDALKNLEGKIEIESEPGQGTLFRVYIPL